MIQIISRKYFSEWANGTAFSANTSDFATHLKGSVGEKLKFVTRIRAALIAISDQSNQFEVINGNILRRLQGSWIEDGFQAGQSVSFIKDYTGLQSGNAAAVEWSATIDALSHSEILLSSISGSFVIGPKTDHALACTSKFDAINFRFGFVENSATADYLSPYTNDLQAYYFGAIDTTTPTEHTMTVAGGRSASKSWYSGDATVKYISSSDPLGISVSYLHEYEVTQVFVINPVFIENYLEQFDSGTQPDAFIGGNSIRHVCQYELKFDLTNPNTSVRLNDEQNLGSVGWFGENYNGFNDSYTISNVAYQDTDTFVPVDGLQLSQKTTISGRINGSGFTNTSKAGAYFFWAAPNAVYSAKKDSFQDTFLWDSVIGTMSGGAFTTTGTERIKRFELTYVSASRIDFEMDIEFSDAEIAMINPDLLETVADNYFVGIQIGNTNATDTSDKLIAQADWAEFVVNNDVEGLCRFADQRFYDHGMVDTSGGFTDYKGWKQDGFVYGCSIFLNKTDNASLNALQARLVAYNTVTGDEFDIQKYIFDLSSQVAVGSYQKLSLDSNRGFKLTSTDQFNQVYLFFNDPVSGEQEVEVKLGVKFDWQSWIRLATADTVFYNTAIDSNGMGRDASRYSMNENYEIRLMIDADIDNGDVVTRYTDMSPDLDIYGFGLEDDNPAEWSAVVETFDMDGNDLGGAILTNADTKFKITWTPLSGNTASFTNSWAVHRIEAVNANGYNTIEEFSSIWTPRTGNILKASPGETLLKVTDFTTYIETECVIDFTKLSGTDYNLSGRIGRYATYPRYGIARDVKYLSEGELLMFNCASNGVAASNSLRIATLGNDGEIIAEEAIALNNAYTYQNWRMQVSTVQTNGKYNFYAVTYTGTATELHEFIYNGSTYIQTRIYTANIGGSGPTAIRIDDQLEPNGRPYIWFGNRDAAIDGQKGFKHAYYDGAAWQFLNWKCYTGTPGNNHMNHPQDLIFDNANVYVMNFDNPPQAAQYNQGRIGVYYQSSGSTTTPADRANFANYTFVYNIYRNADDDENVDGLGNVGDLAFDIGFERLEVDANSNPVFLIVHDSSTGARHFSRIYANTVTPTSDADWTIQTPMAASNGSYGAPEALIGTASASAESSPMQRKNQCHICIIDANSWITGHQAAPYWVKHTIADWTGASPNSWAVYTPADPQFDFTSGNILIE